MLKRILMSTDSAMSNYFSYHSNITNQSTSIIDSENHSILFIKDSNEEKIIPIFTGLPSSSDICENSVYHPKQWAEHANTIRLSSSPDRMVAQIPVEDATSSPIRSSSSPVFFSPPQQQQQQTSQNLVTYLPSTSTCLKRGRPRNEEISNLILSGSNSSSSIKCNICHRVFPRDKSLQAHMRTHTGQRPYRCDFNGCGRAFAQSGQLRTHQRLHTGEKPFICKQEGCQNLFTHPNRRCSLHPSAGIKRIIPVQIFSRKRSSEKCKDQDNTVSNASTNEKTKKLPVIARKSVIIHTGRTNASRKLDDELMAVQNNTSSTNNNNNENDQEFLGALALMKLARSNNDTTTSSTTTPKPIKQRILQSIQIN